MGGSRPRPRRTLAVAILDPILDALVAVRKLARRMGPEGSRADRRLLRGILIASLAILVGTVVLVTVLVRTPDQLAPLGVGPTPDSGLATDAESGSPGIGFSPAASAPPAPRASTPAPPTAAAPPAVVVPPSAPTSAASMSPLAARLAVEQPALLSYQASVAISNPGSVPVTGWTLVITLPRKTLSITGVVGAEVTRDGATWTFVPDQSTRELPGGKSVQVRFQVDGAAIGAAPTSCVIDGQACGIAPS